MRKRQELEWPWARQSAAAWVLRAAYCWATCWLRCSCLVSARWLQSERLRRQFLGPWRPPRGGGPAAGRLAGEILERWAPSAAARPAKRLTRQCPTEFPPANYTFTRTR